MRNFTLSGLCLVAATAAVGPAVRQAAAQDELSEIDSVDEPAGELPEDEDSAPMEETPAAKANGLPRASGEGVPAATEKDAEMLGDNWESYDGPGVAQEVTGGVRVEDIVEPPTEYRYAAFGKPDPFVPPMITEKDPAPDALPGNLEIPIVSPLQRYPLSQLSLVGVWQLTSGERKAMVLAPSDSLGIIVKNGDPIGDRGGKIIAIGDEFLTVREFLLAPDGTRQFEDKQLHMGGARQEVAGRIRFAPGKKQTEVVGADQPSNVETLGAPPVMPAASGGQPEPTASEVPPTASLAPAIPTASPAEALPTEMHSMDQDAAAPAFPTATGVPVAPAFPTGGAMDAPTGP